MPRRVFIGLSEVAGYYRGLREGFEDLGIATMFVDEIVSPYGYSKPGLLARSGMALAGARAGRDRARSRTARFRWSLQTEAVRVVRAALKASLLARAAVTCDAFIFSSGDTFFRRRDVALLRRLGKPIVMVFTGSDHRPPYLNGRLVRSMAETGPEPLIAETTRIARRVSEVEQLADVIVAATASAQFHRRPHVEFITVGIPVARRARPARGASVFNGTDVRILHAPSDPAAKGSDRIREAVGALIGRGIAIDYVELTGRPNAEVMAALRDCDFVVDEVFSDTPMGVLAAEAALFGKPAVVGGYFARVAADVLPIETIPPTLFCEPEGVGEAIERLVTDVEFRRDLGRRAQEFVQSRWSPRHVAERYVKIIDGVAPAEWMSDPATATYVHGWGMSRETWREGIRQIVAAGGPLALGLAEKPDMEARLLAEVRQPARAADGAATRWV